MNDRVYGRLNCVTTCRAVAVPFVLFTGCQVGFSARADALGALNKVLDVRWRYSPTEVRDVLADPGTRPFED